MAKKAKKYFIATQLESGEFEIIDEIEAKNDIYACAIAEQFYSNLEWYLLDENKKNIHSLEV